MARKAKRTKETKVSKDKHNFAYDFTTEKGDFYRCSNCDKLIHESELFKYGN